MLIGRTLKSFRLNLCVEFSHLLTWILPVLVCSNLPASPAKKSKQSLNQNYILPQDQRKLIIVLCSKWDSCSCWPILKPTAGTYFISKDDLLFSVYHMALQLHRLNRFVGVNFSSVLNNSSCVEIFIKCLGR